MKSACLVVGFNRSDLLKQALENLPQDGRRIYVAIDGPRENLPFETRASIETLMKWKETNSNHYECVQTRVNKYNLGCRKGVQTAIDWAFENEETLIIIEDDIQTTQTFFNVMDVWLSKFASDYKIGHLNGFCPVPDNLDFFESYLSKYTHVWGWATWRDRWQKYDRELLTWNRDIFDALPGFAKEKTSSSFDHYWVKQLDMCDQGYDTWDIQWNYTNWLFGNLSVTPTKSLTGNVGFDARATHTKSPGNDLRTKLARELTIEEKQSLIDSSPKYDSFRNCIQDAVEHGIGNSPLTLMLGWIEFQFKNGFGASFTDRGYLYKTLLKSCLRNIKTDLISIGDSENLKRIMKIFRIIDKCFKWAYWRKLRPIIEFIDKCFKWAYWRKLRPVIRAKTRMLQGKRQLKSSMIKKLTELRSRKVRFRTWKYFGMMVVALLKLIQNLRLSISSKRFYR